MSRKWLITVIEVDDEKFDAPTWSRLPDMLQYVVSKLGSEFKLKRFYLQTAAAKKKTVTHLEETSLTYPPKVKETPNNNLIYLADYDRQRRRKRAGSDTPSR